MKRRIKMVTDFTKQSELIKPHDIDTPIHIIGAGALGSWVVFFLLKMGFSNLHVYDFDEVEEHNLPNQFFTESHIGQKKVSGVLNLYHHFFEEEEDRVDIHPRRVDDSNAHTLNGIVLSCVDSMTARKEIYETAFKYGPARLWIEGRLSLYGAYVYALDTKDEQPMKKYEETLYADTEAEVSACGVSQTALPAAVNAASIMIMQMIEYLNGNKLTNRLEYSIPWLVSMTETW
jgi:molybdopterin/thiamine biosynthesis adenylyltransferase